MVIDKLSNTAADWELSLKQLLPLFGHRNWIVVADSAYPDQSNPGIETIATRMDQIEVLSKVLAAIESSLHIRARILVDEELDLVTEQVAPGVNQYRQELTRLAGSRTFERLPHEQIISKLDESAKLFRILILKSNLAIPYTSVFFELDCGYWTPEAEKALRASLQKQSSNGNEL